jgi:hypothetical protein
MNLLVDNETPPTMIDKKTTNIKTIPTSKVVQAGQSKFQTLGAMYW